MTAIDVTMSKALVAALNGETFSNSATSVYSRDAAIDLASLASATIYVDGTVSHERQTRQSWSRNVTLDVLAVAPQSVAGDPGLAAVEDEKDAWLAFVDDELIELIKAQKVEGRKAGTIEFDNRLDADNLRDKSMFYSKFQVTYAFV